MKNSKKKSTIDTRNFLAHWLFTPLAGLTLKNWGRFLKISGMSIPPRYWPRATFTTGMSILNSAISLLEKKRFNPQISSAEVKNPLFIIGHHRSGTTHLWNLLSRHSRFTYPNVLQAVFPHTFLTFEQSIQGLARKFAPQKRPQDNVPFDPRSPIEEERAICTSSFLSIQMARHLPRMRNTFKKYLSMKEASDAEREQWKSVLDRFARKLLVKHGPEATLLFKAPDHTAKIRLLLELYPDARFIHIHREPYRVYQSTMKMERETLSLYAYQKLNLEKLEDFVLWRYQAMYDALLDDIPLIPEGQYAEVAYTRLDNNPLQVLEKIYNTLSIPGFENARPAIEAYVKSIAGYQKNTYPELSPEKKKKIYNRWQRSFEAFGYE